MRFNSNEYIINSQYSDESVEMTNEQTRLSSRFFLGVTTITGNFRCTNLHLSTHSIVSISIEDVIERRKT